MQKRKNANCIFICLVLLSVVFLFPVYLVVMNSFKSRFNIVSDPFTFPNSTNFAGLDNYVNGLKSADIFASLGRTLFITVVSVIVIILMTSMAAWYLTRVKNKTTKIIYYLFIFSIIVPFQMIMFSLTTVCYNLGLNNIFGIVFVYLGFGSGMSVFLFSGFIKSIPTELEEAAMIDGCGPVKTFFFVIFPILKPTAITVAILNAMWIWNDFLLPYLLLGSGEKTLSVAIQIAMQGAYGSIDWGGFMAMLVVAVIPIIIFYLFCQKYIIKGVVDGAVKG